MKDLALGVASQIELHVKESNLLLLRAIHASEATAGLSWRNYRESGYEIEMLTGEECHLLPALTKRLGTLSVDDSSLEKLKGHYRYTWTKNQVKLKELADALGELASHGIDNIVLKDGGFLLGVDAPAQLRPLGTQWILVKSEDFAQALNVASSKSLPFRICRHLPCDLQKSAWADAAPIYIGEQPARILSPADFLLNHLLCLKCENPNQAVWFADTVRLIKANYSEEDGQRFTTRVNSCCLALPVLRAWLFFRKLAGLVDCQLDACLIVDALDTMSISMKEMAQRSAARLKALI